MKFGKKSEVTENEFGTEPVYNEKYLKTKIKTYKEKINTYFYNNEIPTESSHCIFLSVILIYYLQVILEECRFVIEKKMPEYITGDIESSYGNSAIEDSDKILIKKVLMKEIRYRMSQMIYSYIL